MQCLIGLPNLFTSFETSESGFDLLSLTAGENPLLVVDDEVQVSLRPHCAVREGIVPRLEDAEKIHLADSEREAVGEMSENGRFAVRRFRSLSLEPTMFRCREEGDAFRISKGADDSDRCLLCLRVLGDIRAGEFVSVAWSSCALKCRVPPDNDVRDRPASGHGFIDVVALLEPGQCAVFRVYEHANNKNRKWVHSVDEYGLAVRRCVYRWDGKRVTYIKGVYA